MILNLIQLELYPSYATGEEEAKSYPAFLNPDMIALITPFDEKRSGLDLKDGQRLHFVTGSMRAVQVEVPSGGKRVRKAKKAPEPEREVRV